jgi:SAM-dependent methyltransferase
MQNADFKRCCADFYQDQIPRLLFGESMHPGALELTRELGTRLAIQNKSRILDVACGIGTSAVFLAKEFGCYVTGLDLAEQNVEEAQKSSSRTGVSHLVDFMIGDAERIDFEDGVFDSVICECSLCLFPNKKKAAEEAYRVTRKGGKIGMSDIVVRGSIPQSLQDSLYRFACLQEAENEGAYMAYLQDAGFANISVFDKKDAIMYMLDDIHKKMFMIELLKGLGKIVLEADLERTKRAIREVRECINSGILSYVLMTGEK